MNLDLLKTFVAIAESGSLSRTAERLRVAQSTLTRQVQALEAEIGGRLLERSHRGVALTAAGQALLAGIRPLVGQLDAAVAEARKLARGQSGSVRIGYVMSAATEYLNPALAVLRAKHPEVKVKLVDLSPGEQIAGLRKGELDVALVGLADASLAREFYVRRLASLPVVVALPEGHALAKQTTLKLADLRGVPFIGARDADLPGFDRWVTGLCRRAKFRPQFVEDADSLGQALSLLVAENAVTFLPALANPAKAPGVVVRPLDEPAARWDLHVAWQRGRMTEAVRTLVGGMGRAQRAGKD